VLAGGLRAACAALPRDAKTDKVLAGAAVIGPRWGESSVPSAFALMMSPQRHHARGVILGPAALEVPHPPQNEPP
jgi:hypothetical protein